MLKWSTHRAESHELIFISNDENYLWPVFGMLQMWEAGTVYCILLVKQKLSEKKILKKFQFFYHQIEHKKLIMARENGFSQSLN